MVTADHFHQSNLIEGFDSAEADECLREAWKYLSKQKVITKGVICKTQKIATLHQRDLQPDWRGYYRNIPVWIGRREAPTPKTVEKKMRTWCRYYMNRTPKEAHIEFEHIHPFVDGNGRTGRLLMWWHEIKEGMKPTLITYDERFQYYAWFK